MSHNTPIGLLTMCQCEVFKRVHQITAICCLHFERVRLDRGKCENKAALVYKSKWKLKSSSHPRPKGYRRDSIDFIRYFHFQLTRFLFIHRLGQVTQWTGSLFEAHWMGKRANNDFSASAQGSLQARPDQTPHNSHFLFKVWTLFGHAGGKHHA